MHRTDSFDFAIVLSGELTSRLDCRGEQVLRPGDVYVQNGAMRLWRNDTDEPAAVVVISLPAERRPSAGPRP